MVSGLSLGLTNLLFNVSAGTITSVTSFASFISRNLDILSCDPEHLARQEILRHQMPSNFSTGVIQLSSSFFISIIGAIGGLAEQPIQSINNSENLIFGLSRGVIGLFTKPIAALAELINQSGQGLLRVTGANKIPSLQQRSNRPLNPDYSKFKLSIAKCIWSIIGIISLKNFNDNNSFYLIEGVCAKEFYIEADLSSCYIFLTNEVLFIINEKEDSQERSFFLTDINISIVKQQNENTANAMIVITVNENKINSESKNTDRVIDYINQFDRFANNKIEYERYYYNFTKKYGITDNDLEISIENNNNNFICSCGEILVLKTENNLLNYQSNKINDILKISDYNEISKNGQKNYFFFVDPRISKDFIRNFYFLKEKLLKEKF